MVDSDISGNTLLEGQSLELYTEKKKILQFLREKIDADVGYNYWKNYITSAFWSTIATPLNLTITFLTAITAAQSQNSQLIPTNIYEHITLTNLIITTFITFFRPHEQYSVYSDFVKQWTEIGVDLEKEYSTKSVAKKRENPRFYHLQKIDDKIERYRNIQNRCLEVRKSQNKLIMNGFTDLIFFFVYYICMCRLSKGPKKWLDADKEIYREIDGKNKKPGIKKNEKEPIADEITEQAKDIVVQIKDA